MIYAYDQWAQMPTKDIYDTQMMAMAINAAKDQYDRGEKRLKEFRDEYGDFYSPSDKHQQFYNENFNVGGFIEDLRNRGIDPLRSIEGRALVQNYINTRPYADLKRMKKSAETYDEYQKNVAKAKANNTYNQAFEDFRNNGRNIKDLGVNEVWDTSSPGVYTDLNQYAGHLFDKMQDEYISTDEQGRDWYGVSEDRRRRALTPMMGDLLSTDLGQFYYEQSRANAAKLLGRTPTESEVLNQFANDVITTTHEYDRRNWKENPEYKRRKDYEWANKLDAAKSARDYYYKKKLRAGTPGFDENGNPIKEVDEGVSLFEHGYTTALANTLGPGYDRNNIDFKDAGRNINKIQKEFGKTAGTDVSKFENRYTSKDAIHVEDIKSLHGGNTTTLGFEANMEDINRLSSKDDIITGTRGYTGKSTHTSGILRNEVKKAMNAGNFVEIIPHGGTYGAQTKNNYYAVDAPVTIRIYGNSDGTGTFKDYKGYWNMGWDSQAAPSTWNESLLDVYNSVNNMNDLTPVSRTWNRGLQNSLLIRNFDQDDAANVYPYGRDASSDTQATHDRLKAGQSTKLSTSYK